MRCKADVRGDAFLPDFLHEFHDAARAECSVNLFHGRDAVELVDVEMIRVQLFQRIAQILLRPGAIPLVGFTGKMDVLPIRLERDAQLVLGVSVGVCDVKIVNAVLDREADKAVRGRLIQFRVKNLGVKPGGDDAAVRDGGNIDAGASERFIVHSRFPSGGICIRCR